MEGKILHYDKEKTTGVIRDENGNRYDFNIDFWKSEVQPNPGQLIDFVIKDDSATDIYLLNSNDDNKISQNAQKVSKELSSIFANAKNTDLGEKISSLFNNGLNNKIGFIASIVLLVSLFMPIVDIPFLGKASFMDEGTGKILFIPIIIGAIFFGAVLDNGCCLQ